MKSGRIIYALAQMSERERLLLLLLGAVVVPLAVIFLAVLPLTQARDGARNQASEAAAMLDWVAGQVRALPAEGVDARLTSEATAGPIGISGIEDSLVRSGLRARITELSDRPEGGIGLALEGASFDVLGAWLQEMTPVWGYRFASFRIEAAEPGLINAVFELEAAR